MSNCLPKCSSSANPQGIPHWRNILCYGSNFCSAPSRRTQLKVRNCFVYAKQELNIYLAYSSCLPSRKMLWVQLLKRAWWYCRCSEPKRLTSFNLRLVMWGELVLHLSYLRQAPTQARIVGYNGATKVSGNTFWKCPARLCEPDIFKKSCYNHR